MKLTKRQEAIIKKIAKGEIYDIPSYMEAFELSTLCKLDKKDIEKRMQAEEKGKKYRVLGNCEMFLK